MEDKKKAEYNIVAGWNLKKSAKIKDPSFKLLLNDKKFQKLAKAKNLDFIKDAVSIEFNNDVNVAGLANALKERVAAFDWKLKNNYFLFGLKKGLNIPIVFNQNKELLCGKEEIKTKRDGDAMDEMMDRMFSKFYIKDQKSVNPITMEIEKKKVTLIGLPYEMRMVNDVKDLVKIIYPLEKETIEPMNLTMSYKNLIDDFDKPSKEAGAFYRYYNDIDVKEDEPAKVPFDTSSQGNRIANDNINAILREESQDTEEEIETSELPMNEPMRANIEQLRTTR
jgi:hypothetical protein